MIRVAAVELEPELFAFERNVARACDAVAEAASAGARLVVLPECSLSGYIYRDREQFLPFMDSVPGRGTDAIAQVARAHSCYVALGIAEVDPSGLTYNTAALVGPDGYIGKYRKAGLNPSDVRWFTPGTTGYPVFETELGGIAMAICYDDLYWEPARVPALKGADILAYVCASDRVRTELGEAARANHSTIAAVQQLSAWNGLAMVAADRHGTETNPTTGLSVVYGGAASIWQATGERAAALPGTTAWSAAGAGTRILYGDIDPALFANPQRATFARRRPELYTDLAFQRAPSDPYASRQTHELDCYALQYAVVRGDQDATVRQIEEAVSVLLRERAAVGPTAPLPPTLLGPALLVLPAFTLSGPPRTGEEAAAQAESVLGRTAQLVCDLAVRTGAHVVGSLVEADGAELFHAAVLAGPDGRVLATYRQSHDDGARGWMTRGDDLVVVETAIGRIGLMLAEDVRFPEVAGVLAVRRADLIAIPTAWRGDYGGRLQDARDLFAHGYPADTHALWYAVAKCAQAYTVVANHHDEDHLGWSGVFTLDPVNAEPPVVASPGPAADPAAADPPGRPDVLVVRHRVRTTGTEGAWMDQSRMLAGRRVDLAVPLVLDTAGAAYERWRSRPGYDTSAWTAYEQGPTGISGQG